MRRIILAGALAAVLLAAAPARAQLWLTYGEASEFQGEPAVRFQVQHVHGMVWCVGYLYLTKTRVGYEVLGPRAYMQDSFVRPRGEVQMQFLGQMRVKGGLMFRGALTAPSGEALRVQLLRGRKYDFYIARNIGSDGSAQFDAVSAWPLQDAWNNFDQALERARTHWDPNRPQVAVTPPPPAPAPEPPKTATLQIEAQLGGAEFYVDDEFKGTTSSEGRVKVSDLAPGEHRLRLSRKDYQEWTRTVSVEPGETRTIEVQLAEAKPPAPPPPPPPPDTSLSLDDVVKLLDAGVTPVRVEAIVKERGVKFTLNEEVEKKLRDVGATDALLLAIAKAKK